MGRRTGTQARMRSSNYPAYSRPSQRDPNDTPSVHMTGRIPYAALTSPVRAALEVYCTPCALPHSESKSARTPAQIPRGYRRESHLTIEILHHVLFEPNQVPLAKFAGGQTYLSRRSVRAPRVVLGVTSHASKTVPSLSDSHRAQGGICALACATCCSTCSFSPTRVSAPRTQPGNLLDHRLDGSTICLLKVAAAQIAAPRFRVAKDTIAGAS